MTDEAAFVDAASRVYMKPYRAIAERVGEMMLADMSPDAGAQLTESHLVFGMACAWQASCDLGKEALQAVTEASRFGPASPAHALREALAEATTALLSVANGAFPSSIDDLREHCREAGRKARAAVLDFDAAAPGALAAKARTDA